MVNLQIGESFVGSGVNAAHTNTILGNRSGPAGVAWATALATPRAGHVPFMVIAKTGLAVTPPTLFVNKAEVESDFHGLLTWGACQAGVAAGVRQALAEGFIGKSEVEDLVIIAAIWLNPSADDEEQVYANQSKAMYEAIKNGKLGLPKAEDLLDQDLVISNPFFRQKNQ
jgi:5,6,7,8-tetrahydromethanopterin hydro-lyase